MATVLILAPMRTELNPVVRRLRLSRDQVAPGARTTWSGAVGDTRVVAAMAGVGTGHAAAVTQDLLGSVAPDHVVVAGVAGGLSAALSVGAVVVPSVVVDLDDGTRHTASPFRGLTLHGSLLTSTVMHGWDVLEPHAQLGAVAVDMETSAVAAVCERSGVAWTAIRGLSDVVSEGTVDDRTLDFVREDGSTNLGGVLRHLARHPFRVGALARMGRDAAQATGAVAATLAAALRVPEAPPDAPGF